jgi:hypothetical protein
MAAQSAMVERVDSVVKVLSTELCLALSDGA